MAGYDTYLQNYKAFIKLCLVLAKPPNLQRQYTITPVQRKVAFKPQEYYNRKRKLCQLSSQPKMSVKHSHTWVNI